MKIEKISYEEAQDLLHKLVNTGDAETVTALFEYGFARIVSGSAFYDPANGEIEFQTDPEIPDWL
jgi:hypothetical protein